MSIKSLIINPGSTSTKIGVFEDENLLFEETLRHSTEEISRYETIFDQKDFRKQIITDLLAAKNFDLKSLNVVVGRGGMLKPIPGGTYAVTDDLLADLRVGVQGQHASNLGGILAREIADSIGVPAYIVDPVVVDELMPIARYSGMPEIPRGSIFHALNQKAVAKRYAKEIGKAYESLRLIVVHMGGGVSVGAHEGGRVVDVFSALPYATITGRFSFFEMLGGYGFLVLCLIYMKIREPKVLLAALTLLLIISVKILIELF